MYTISFFHEKNGFSPKQNLRAKPGEILLEILLRNKVPVRHDCGGVCYCTTCHVYIEKGQEFLEEPSKRENDFLKRVAERKAASRLACQCLLLEGSGKIEVHLPKTAAYLQQ